MTPSGIEPAAYQFVAQHLNHSKDHNYYVSQKNEINASAGVRLLKGKY